MIDLHIHSNFSDSTATIEEIISLVEELGLTQFAVTDHNTIKGTIKAHELCPDKEILGTELSVGYEGEELHMLGYFPNGSDFKNVSFIIKTGEVEKAIATAEMVERLNEQGYMITVNELSKYTNGIVNRVHICNALMDHGYISSIKEGFDTLVGNHCPAYVARRYSSVAEGVEAIHQDGGIAVIAHPFNYKPLAGKEVKMLDDIVDLIDGIECIHPSVNEQQINFLKEYAKAHDKLITGGSDFHGANKPKIFLGMMNVPDEYQIKK